MTHSRTTLCLLAAAFVLTFVGPVTAQKRAHEGLFLNARLGIGTYGGDRDGNSGEGLTSPSLGDKFSESSYSFGLEFGTNMSRAFSLSIGYQLGNYSEIASNQALPGGDENCDWDDPDFPCLDKDSPTVRHTIPLLVRWMILSKSTLSPYLHAGGSVTIGSIKFQDGESKTHIAYGPTVGFGLDFVVSRNNSIFLETTQHLTFTDFKVDAAGTNKVGVANDYAYDVLGFWGLGLRHSFKPACGPPEITSVDAPTRIAIGEAAPVTVMIDDDACEPVDISWQFGDGEAGVGLAANHMFATPGTYTVQATATNSYGSDTATRTIEVFDPCPVDASIIAINLSPNDPIINESITFTADVRGTAPLTYAWDFGDGSSATGARASHTYGEPGEYTVTLSCSNCGGTDIRKLTIRVTEFRCSDITELNSVFFSRNSTEIDETASGLLNENVTVLSECPDLLVRLDGYSDRGERNPMRLSEGRAGAVEQYYIGHGVSANRLLARGLGRDPLAGKGVDGLRNRRVDSIVVDSFE